MDRDHADDIFMFFKEEAESDSVEDALNELGEDEYWKRRFDWYGLNLSQKGN